ncbi:hypothetical protein [Virgibacillus proomii]|jgi:chromosome segregation ATPase|uniref:hypothetical protein n=1 Tax=Virgibacillus proomii TaxID=84407 RepID=UPI00098426D0|nr:hypothetical protein [Virgibacillus proomii]
MLKISHSNEALSNVWFVAKPNKAALHTPLSKIYQDSVRISGQAFQLFNGIKGKKQNLMIESLMKQRESLVEMKNTLTEQTLEAGNDISSIQEQLKEFEKQITELDNEIAKQQMEEHNRVFGKEEQVKKTPQSEEEQIVAQATLLGQAKNMKRVFKGMEREKNILESEMKLDASRGIYSERKQEKLIKLKEKLQTVQEQVKEKMQQPTDTSVIAENSIDQEISEPEESVKSH